MSFVASLFVQSIHGLYSKDRHTQVLSTRTNENITIQKSLTGTKFKDFNENRDLLDLSSLFSKTKGTTKGTKKATKSPLDELLNDILS